MIQYFKDSVKELRQEVTWPSWAELQQTTVVVIIASVMLALSVWAIDKVWVFILGFLY
ncbi:MAG: preprotein translocase subunit SecE [Aureispira sp.]|nr:preprotein translocase subunit SecE [Aureispira sp.]